MIQATRERGSAWDDAGPNELHWNSRNFENFRIFENLENHSQTTPTNTAPCLSTSMSENGQETQEAWYHEAWHVEQSKSTKSMLLSFLFSTLSLFITSSIICFLPFSWCASPLHSFCYHWLSRLFEDHMNLYPLITLISLLLLPLLLSLSILSSLLSYHKG